MSSQLKSMLMRTPILLVTIQNRVNHLLDARVSRVGYTQRGINTPSLKHGSPLANCFAVMNTMLPDALIDMHVAHLDTREKAVSMIQGI